MTLQEVESGSRCWCLTGSKTESAIVYLLAQIAGMTLQDVEQGSRCWCFTGTAFERATVYLLAQIAANGGQGGGGAGVTNLALAGAQPPTDGSITTYYVFDTNTGFLWYNSATLGFPTWNNV